MFSSVFVLSWSFSLYLIKFVENRPYLSYDVECLLFGVGVGVCVSNSVE